MTANESGKNILLSKSGSKIIAGILKIPTLILLVFSLITLVFVVDDFISSGGFTDAAPYWVFLLMIALILGIPGMVLLYISKIFQRNH